ncbi:MAG: hypothetical protein JWO94_286, partial [Verrucomicrobiaceae bacterium]|nr:hypothetical protein [Verrucomicrobiaceae bacterium]
MRLSRVLPALAIASTMAFTSPAWAMPATPKAVVVHQPDGTAFKLFIRGNAHFNWYEDMQGYTVVQSNGTFFYAKLDANGKLVASPLLAGESKPADAGLVPYILPTDEIRLANANHQEAVHNTTLSNMKLAGLAPGTPALGTVKNLVVLCRFSDQTAASGRLQAEYNTIFNATGGDPVLAPTGSVKDYYLAASYGQLTLNSTVTVWVTLPHTEAYYANGNTGDSYKDDEPTYPKNVAGMTEDALNAVAALSGNDKINFKDFDANNDGFIDCISIVHSGYGAETGTNKNQVWSQKNDLSQLPGGKWTSPSTPGNLNGDGVPVSVFDFHTEPALNSTTGTDICRIGVIIHETGHFFGLPDLYDHGGKSSGLGSYCLMANSWGWDNEGNRPSIPSAWCRVKLGWTIPQIITSGTFSAPQVETIKDNSVFKITQGFPAGEYLLVENRQPVGSDSQIPQGGLAIWHVDDKVQGNDNVGFPGQAGWPTNGKHYQVAMLQADGLFNLEKNDSADEGDLYRAGGHTAVTPTTTPNTKTYQDGVVTDSKNSITNISATGATMTFTLNASALGAPVITSAGTAPGTVGTAFSYQITATNSPTIFSATGLPAGFTLNASTGVITATPAATVNATATIKATNGTGTGSASLIISVVPAPPTLAQALDAAAFNWTSTTSPPWVGEKTVTHDGID